MTSLIPKIGPRRLVDMVYEELKQSIILLKLEPGTVLIEEQLAEQMGVSKTPIRSAFAKLEREGFIETRPHKGSRVTPVDMRTVKETYETKIALEGYALRIVCNKLTSGDITTMKAFLLACEAALRDKDEIGWLQNSNAFHRFFIERFGNRSFSAIIDNINDHLQRARAILFAGEDWGALELMHQYHVSILQAVENKDPVLAEARLYEHTTKFISALESNTRRRRENEEATGWGEG